MTNNYNVRDLFRRVIRLDFMMTIMQKIYNRFPRLKEVKTYDMINPRVRCEIVNACRAAIGVHNKRKNDIISPQERVQMVLNTIDKKEPLNAPEKKKPKYDGVFSQHNENCADKCSIIKEKL